MDYSLLFVIEHIPIEIELSQASLERESELSMNNAVSRALSSNSNQFSMANNQPKSRNLSLGELIHIQTF